MAPAAPDPSAPRAPLALSGSRRAAVLGSPIVHSLSPVLHRAAYTALGLDWSYEAIDCDEAGLPALLDGLDASWAGLSLTMPLKRCALKLVDTCSDLAIAVGGVNTIVLAGGRRHGHNTDVHGMESALAEAGIVGVGSALVLGGGATACSALAALNGLGVAQAVVVVREPGRAAEAVAAAERLAMTVSIRTFADLSELLPVDLVISTLPAGAADPFAGRIADSGSAVFDVVYAPWPTTLAATAAAAGAPVVGGFPMLLHQAVRQVELMTGRSEVPVAAMRDAGTSELRRRTGG